jgi:putative hemolysin
MRRDTTICSLGFVVFVGLAGCAAAPSKVLPAGNDAYQVSVSGARFESQADTNLKALNAAHDYCDKQGKHLMFRQSTETGDHSWDPKQEELTFVCIDTNDPGYMRASVQRDPAVIAQQ